MWEDSVLKRERVISKVGGRERGERQGKEMEMGLGRRHNTKKGRVIAAVINKLGGGEEERSRTRSR